MTRMVGGEMLIQVNVHGRWSVDTASLLSPGLTDE